MTAPWKGDAFRLAPGSFERAAADIGLDDPAALEAVWMVESGGKPFRRDGSLTRRFEPHKFPETHWPALGFDPGAAAPSEASRAIGEAARERMFEAAFEIDVEAAFDATSWGGGQIMGFNAESVNFPSARAMVAAFADSEAAQLAATCVFIRSNNLVTALRARDWAAFAYAYNGPDYRRGAYAQKIAAAYRRLTGEPSPVMLREGGSGAAVERLQRALVAVGYQIEPDGVYGPETAGAVRAFQENNGLTVDGVVGARTWQVLADAGQVKPPRQVETPDLVAAKADALASKGAAIGAILSAIASLADGLNDTAQLVLISGGVALALVAGGVWAWRVLRGSPTPA